jgi:hypothetical protein
VRGACAGYIDTALQPAFHLKLIAAFESRVSLPDFHYAVSVFPRFAQSFLAFSFAAFDMQIAGNGCLPVYFTC